MQILVIEDEKQARDSLGKFLRHPGHDVRFAREGHEGRREASASACRTRSSLISECPDWMAWAFWMVSESPPVILLTGHADMASVVSAIRLGAFDYLTKPASARLKKYHGDSDGGRVIAPFLPRPV